MKVSYIGNFRPSFSTENHVKKSLEALGHEVVPLQEDSTALPVLRRAAMGSDILMHTTTWDCLPHEEMAQLRLDLGKKGIPVVGYHLDLFWGLNRNARRWMDEPMFYGDWFFSTDGNHEEEWSRIPAEHRWLPAGVYHAETQPGRPRSNLACDVAFVGSDGRNYHPEWSYRRELTRHLERTYRHHYRNPGGLDPKLREQDLNDQYASAKVTVGDSLCLFREGSLYWSDRVYEATGRGGLLIMPQIDALDQEFEGQLPMYPWGDFEKLDAMIQDFLDHPERRAEVKQACWEITTSRYTYMDRMRTVLEVVGS